MPGAGCSEEPRGAECRDAGHGEGGDAGELTAGQRLGHAADVTAGFWDTMTGDMRRLGMGLIGAGFVGPHHVDAVRRLGYVDIVAVAGSSSSLDDAR